MELSEKTLEDLKAFVKEVFKKDCTGHDAYHTFRVYQLALALAKTEKADLEKVTLLALLHDVDDVKLFGKEGLQFPNAKAFLRSHGFSEEFIQTVVEEIHLLSFKGTDSSACKTIEGKIVQDADRLDALGAIGIARAFAYGGFKDREIYNPSRKPILNMDEKAYRKNEGTTINHFYEKLLLLKDLMNTNEGKRIAKERTEYMKEYLHRFFLEWDEKDFD